jgi:hypothetical protein
MSLQVWSCPKTHTPGIVPVLVVVVVLVVVLLLVVVPAPPLPVLVLLLPPVPLLVLPEVVTTPPQAMIEGTARRTMVRRRMVDGGLRARCYQPAARAAASLRGQELRRAPPRFRACPAGSARDPSSSTPR